MTITTRPAPIRPPSFAKASEGRPTRHLALEGPKAVPALHGLQQFQVPFDAEQRFENFFFLVRHDGVGHKRPDEGHWLRLSEHFQVSRLDASSAFNQPQPLTG